MADAFPLARGGQCAVAAGISSVPGLNPRTLTALAASSPTTTHGDLFSFSPDALHALADAVIALDSNYRITYCNPAAERLYGLRGPDVVGERFADVVSCRPPLNPIGVPSNPAEAALTTIGLAPGRTTHISRSGHEVSVCVSVLPCKSGSRPSPSSSHYLAIIADDSERVRLASEMAERLKFERLMANLSARFSNLPEDEIDGEVELWLRRLVEMLRVDRGAFIELTADGVFTVTHAYAVPGVPLTPKGPASATFPWIDGELRARRPVIMSRIPDDFPAHATREREHFAHIGMRSGIALPIEVGHAVVCVLSFASFTREGRWPPELVSRLQLGGDVFANAIVRRQAKRRLEQKQSELVHVGRVAAVGELASVIAHELDQPLTAVVSNAQAIRYLLEAEEPDVGEIDEALKDVIDGAMRVSEIVRRERRLLRRSESSFAAVDLNELIREIELFIRAEARQDGAKVSLELVPGLPPVFADRVQLQQVVLNLGRNALQAMRDQPRETRTLRIRTRSRSGELELSVIDTGRGVADDSQLQRVFEPFYTTKPSGLGMGLSISKSIIEGHHGRIWASRNSTGGGLTFCVALPRAEAAGVGAAAAAG